jgi:hypothetical protein
MLSIIEREPLPRVSIDEAPTSEPSRENNVEFEIVLGRGQIASILFLAVVIVVAFSVIAYRAGKSL